LAARTCGIGFLVGVPVVSRTLCARPPAISVASLRLAEAKEAFSQRLLRRRLQRSCADTSVPKLLRRAVKLGNEERMPTGWLCFGAIQFLLVHSRVERQDPSTALGFNRLGKQYRSPRFAQDDGLLRGRRSQKSQVVRQSAHERGGASQTICFTKTLELRPLVSYFSRRAGGKLSGEPSL